jgi:hypothetical protein
MVQVVESWPNKYKSLSSIPSTAKKRNKTKRKGKKVSVVLTPVILATWEAEIRRIDV